MVDPKLLTPLMAIWWTKLGQKIAIIAVRLFLSIGLTACSNGDSKQFSSKSSPDGRYVAENHGYVHNERGGFILLTRSDGSAKKQVLLRSPETHPDLFFVWRDNSHLEIMTEGVPLSGLDRFEDIEVTYLAYRYQAPNYAIPHSTWTIMPNAGDAKFAKTAIGGARRLCSLNIAIRDDLRKANFGVLISASVGACSHRPEATCGGIETHLWMRKEVLGPEPLTSATISAIPSYNRIPDGDGHAQVRGQFLEDSAARLIDEMQKPHFTLQYAFNFGEPIIAYDVDATLIAPALKDFTNCTVGADFKWMQHR